MNWLRDPEPRLAAMDDEAVATPVFAAPGGDGFEPWLAEQPEAFGALAAANGFRGQKGRLLTAPASEGGVAMAALGVGPGVGSAVGSGGDPMVWAAAGAGLPGGLYEIGDKLSADDATKAALAWRIGAYRFARYRAGAGSNDERPRLKAPDGVDHAAIERQADADAWARDLINTPANDLGPEELAEAWAQLAQRHGAAFEVITGDALRDGFPLIHAVGRASVKGPRLIDLRWGDPGAPAVTLVGKGVCFDSGGLNIKTGDYMALMKKDMGGAAHVFALAHLIMASGLPVRLRALVPAVENAVSGDAFRPGDVAPSRKGLSVEIFNTDAEGRLILADALAYAGEEEGRGGLIIQMATLTGAARVALGPDPAPFYTDNEALSGQLTEAAAAVGDPVWRLPLWEPYASALDSPVADLCHTAKSAAPGSIIAALFLKRFAPDPTNWLHFDIYAWNRQSRPGRPEGGVLQGVRALFEMLERRFRG